MGDRLSGIAYNSGMDNLPDYDPAPEPAIIVFGRPNCPMVPPVLRLLRASGAAYEYVDIRQDSGAADQLRAITGGFESVPTLLFPDGRALVEPSVLTLRRALQDDAPEGAAPVSAATTLWAMLSNPLYIILALLILAIILSRLMQG